MNTANYKRFIVDVNKNDIISIENSYIERCNKLKKSNSQKLIHYLQKSDHLSITLDKVKSLFSEESISHSNTLRTDGYWIWSSDLNHYTENHCFQWPKSFIKHIIDAKEINISEKQFRLMEESFNIEKLLKAEVSEVMS